MKRITTLLALAAFAATMFSTQPASAMEPEACTQFKIRYAESTARKLYRALSGKGYELQDADLQPWVEVFEGQVTGEDVMRFSVHPQHDGAVAGVVSADPDYPETYVVAKTERGPIVTRHRWPSSEEVRAGAECRPDDSSVVFPMLTFAEVDVEPFKYWGLRVVWRLPNELPSKAAGVHAHDALTRSIAFRSRQFHGMAAK